jgi:hypothetical protein
MDFKGRLFAASDRGVLISSDDGFSWRTVDGDEFKRTARCFAWHGDRLYVGQNGGIDWTDDKGVTWHPSVSERRHGGFAGADIVSLLAMNGVIHSSINGRGGAFRSYDDGVSWHEANLAGHHIHSLGSVQNTLFAASDTLVYVSTNEGLTWSTFSQFDADLDGRRIHALASRNDSLVLLTDAGTVLESNTLLADTPQWRELVGGIPGGNGSTVSAWLVHEDTLLAGTTDGGLFTTLLVDSTLSPATIRPDPVAAVPTPQPVANEPTPVISEPTVATAIEQVSGPSSPVPATALLVGINTYDHHADLVNPVRDMQSVAKELREVFRCQTETLLNPTKVEFLTSLRALAERTYQDDEQLLVFFSGHGYFDETIRRGYLAFRDSEPIENDPFLQSFVSHEDVRVLLERLDCNHVLLVVDSCFSGTLDPMIAMAPGARAFDNAYGLIPREEYIRRKLEYRTRRYITAGGKEYVSDGRPGQHSPFARQFLAALRTFGGSDGILTLEEILLHLERVDPQPRTGELFGNEPGSSFVLVAQPPDSPPAIANVEPVERKTGTLRVHLTPSDAAVVIGGEQGATRTLEVKPQTNTVGVRRYQLPVGRYTVHVTKDGYDPQQREIDLGSTLHDLNFHLKLSSGGRQSRTALFTESFERRNGVAGVAHSGDYAHSADAPPLVIPLADIGLMGSKEYAIEFYWRPTKSMAIDATILQHTGDSGPSLRCYMGPATAEHFNLVFIQGHVVNWHGVAVGRRADGVWLRMILTGSFETGVHRLFINGREAVRQTDAYSDRGWEVPEMTFVTEDGWIDDVAIYGHAYQPNASR